MNTLTPTLAPITTGQIAASPYPYAYVYVDDDSLLFVVVNVTSTLPDGSWPQVTEPTADPKHAAEQCAALNRAWIELTASEAQARRAVMARDALSAVH